ncbi:MAG: glycosyltransferase family protein, partial [Peptococcaceae bacterium]|nr:glycosyltransferase family protein [Peptococcaceae bacterium]
PILGKPMLLRQIERIKRSRLIDLLLVATSSDLTDDPIDRLCRENGISCFRGQLDDVLDRFYQAAKTINPKPEHIVRLTGDCPLIDPELIDEVIDFHVQGLFDYTSNTIEPTYPDGLDVEVFTFGCLEGAWQKANLPSQREHVTLYIHQQSHQFKIGSYKNKDDLSYLRWTVDEPLDFELVDQIYKALYPAKPWFTTADILTLLKRKMHLVTLNNKFKRNEGLERSLFKDKAFFEHENNNKVDFRDP